MMNWFGPVIQTVSTEADDLAKVIGAYEGNISPITGQDVEQWVAGFELGAIQKKEFLDGLTQMFGPGGAFISKDQVYAYATFILTATQQIVQQKKGQPVLIFAEGQGGSGAVFQDIFASVADDMNLDLPPLVGQSSTIEDPIFFFVDDMVCGAGTLCRTLKQHKAVLAGQQLLLAPYIWHCSYVYGSNYRVNIINNVIPTTKKSILRYQKGSIGRLLRPYVRMDRASLPAGANLDEFLGTFSDPLWERRNFHILDDPLFKSIKQRKLVIGTLFGQGLKIKQEDVKYGRREKFYPMGMSPFPNFGNGVSTVTWRNIPWNAPTAFWVSNDEYPILFRRR
jgi:hypothetical protein